MYVVDNAVIMAAGTSSRFAPLSYERPKALIDVKGEILIERQIRQLREAGIPEIYIVTGYKAEMFQYLEKKYNVHLVHNSEFLTRNNNGSIYAAKDILKNTYICSADNYFSKNPFEREVDESYYAAVYAEGPTKEWCMECGEDQLIHGVQVGGENAWYMLGHAFWSEEFSKKFAEILEKEYDLPETADLFWENIFINHIDELKMKMRKYQDDIIFEFDSLEELRQFDQTYMEDTRSDILKKIAKELECREADLREIVSCKNGSNEAIGFRFKSGETNYEFLYREQILRRI